MSKTLQIVLISIIIIGSGILLVQTFYKKQKKSGTVFQLDKNVLLDEIIVEKNDTKTHLKFEEANWKTSQDVLADKSKIDYAISSLINLRMNYPVSKEQSNELKKLFADSANTIKLFYKGKQVYTLRFLSNNSQTFAINSKDKIYSLVLPGYEKFNLEQIIPTEPGYWEIQQLLKLSPEKIKKVSVVYAKQEKSGFRLEHREQKFELYDYKNQVMENSDTASILDYIHFFSGVNGMRFDATGFDLINNKPIFSLIVETQDRHTHIESFLLFNKANNASDCDMFAGVVNKNDTLMFRYIDFDPILVSLDYFLKK
ncbi:MAG: DUF4340 domain-containing protein [Bacteroidales bacterium]|nr:DUF4340 domain-containing protein [Bacteroidales bacterium]MBN2819613.1 DUF4340 domain-containing protein [Bacteroidales bacterium]